jgi:hypothetical protein
LNTQQWRAGSCCAVALELLATVVRPRRMDKLTKQQILPCPGFKDAGGRGTNRPSLPRCLSIRSVADAGELASVRLKRRMQPHTGEQQRAGRLRPSALHACAEAREAPTRVRAPPAQRAQAKRRRPRAQVVGCRSRTWRARARESARARKAQACSCPPHELANPAGHGCF